MFLFGAQLSDENYLSKNATQSISFRTLPIGLLILNELGESTDIFVSGTTFFIESVATGASHRH